MAKVSLRLKNMWHTSGFLQQLILVLALPFVGCACLAQPEQLNISVPIPTQSDWTDYGPILEPGALGEWDYQLFGGFTATAVKKNGVYYLYYQGASGYRIIDDSVTWRAIGVATSPDGINFTKVGNDPILTWFPHNNGEEGAVSSGVALDVNGEIVLYYGANTQESATLISADARLATASDGLNFTDLGVVLDHSDGSIWGSGDELFPIIALHDTSRWFVYYIPNGTLQSRKLGVAWGNSRDNLSNSSAVLSGFTTVPVWGGGSAARVGPDTYALFLNDLTVPKVEVRIVSLTAPNQLSAPVATYQFEDVRHATVLLDEESSTWFMYYRKADQNGYGVKVAPAGAPDTTPPTAPGIVTSMPLSDRQVDLTWSQAADPETGIVLYNVFRDGHHLTTTKGWSFSDTSLVEQREYSYEVSAVNYHGVEGPRSAPSVATTLPDVTPPRIVSANASGLTQVTLLFDEPVEEISAETPANYAINREIAVTQALLGTDLKSVILATSEHGSGAYRITVNNVRDRAQIANPITPDTGFSYIYSGATGLAGAWTFDEGRGEIAYDGANYGNDGALLYTDKPGPTWTAGKEGSALHFDGIDDQVTVEGSGSLQDVTDGSHSFAAWVQPDSVPPNTTANDASYTVLGRGYTGLYYDHDENFRAVIRLADGREIAVTSGRFDPQIWHHLAMIVDDTNKKLHLYVDGQEVNSSPVAYTGLLADHEEVPYYFGTSDPLTERYELRFSGRIDEVQIYSRALTTAEIQEISTSLANEQLYLPVLLHLQPYPVNWRPGK